MNKLNSIIILILLAVIIAGSIFSIKRYNMLERQTTEMQNQLAAKDTVTVVDSVTVKKLSLLVSKIQVDNARLRGELVTYNKAILALKDSIKNVSTVDTVYVHDNQYIGVRAFDIGHGVFHIKGNFYKQEPWLITFDELSANVGIEIAAIEKNNGTWETTVITNDKSVKVNTLDTRYRKLKKRSYILGAQAIMDKNNIGVSMIAGYDKSAITLGYGTNGMILGATYFIKCGGQ